MEALLPKLAPFARASAFDGSDGIDTAAKNLALTKAARRLLEREVLPALFALQGIPAKLEPDSASARAAKKIRPAVEQIGTIDATWRRLVGNDLKKLAAATLSSAKRAALAGALETMLAYQWVFVPAERGVLQELAELCRSRTPI